MKTDGATAVMLSPQVSRGMESLSMATSGTRRISSLSWMHTIYVPEGNSDGNLEGNSMGDLEGKLQGNLDGNLR